MNDLRRILLLAVFAVSLLALVDGWQRHNGQPSLLSSNAGATSASSAGAADGANGVSSALPASALSTDGASPTGVTPASAPATPQGQEIVLRNDVLALSVDTLGASIVRADLLKHHSQEAEGGDVLLMRHDAGHVYEAQSGLIGQSVADAMPDHRTLFTAQAGVRELADGAQSVVLTLSSAPVNGVQLIKTFTLHRGEYKVDVHQEVINASGHTISPQLYVQLERDGSQPAAPSGPAFMGGPRAYTGAAIYNAKGKYQKQDFKHIDEGKLDFESHDDSGWVAMVQHHFVSAWVYTPALGREFFVKKVGPNLYSTGMLLPVGELAAGQRRALDTLLYVGPQDESRLSEIAPGLELVKDYGWTKILAEPMYHLLKFLYSRIGNWGWSIMALVVLLKAAFYWLNASAYRSMAKMKALNPRLQALNEKYKDNPQQKQQEMVKIYREEKVNPIGGCLPIFIQIPFFIALYSVLSSSVEIRNAPWIGWITDLSVRDPYFVLPALMTASTLLQTWLNPTPADPMQARMMWIMPLFFSVMFFFFPAGLVLYWLTNNLLSIAQQWLINRQLGTAK